MCLRSNIKKLGEGNDALIIIYLLYILFSGMVETQTTSKEVAVTGFAPTLLMN
jgi:hypothetical protein